MEEATPGAPAPPDDEGEGEAARAGGGGSLVGTGAGADAEGDGSLEALCVLLQPTTTRNAAATTRPYTTFFLQLPPDAT